MTKEANEALGVNSELTPTHELAVQRVRIVEEYSGIFFPDFDNLGKAIDQLKRITDKVNCSFLTPEFLEDIKKKRNDFFASFDSFRIVERDHDALLQINEYQKLSVPELLRSIRRKIKGKGQFFSYGKSIHSSDSKIPVSELFPAIKVDKLKSGGYILSIYSNLKTLYGDHQVHGGEIRTDYEAKLAEALGKERLLLEKDVEVEFASQGDRASIDFDKVVGVLKPLTDQFSNKPLAVEMVRRRLRKMPSRTRGQEIASYLGSFDYWDFGAGFSLGVKDGIEMLIGIKEDNSHIDRLSYAHPHDWVVDGAVLSNIETKDSPLGIVLKFVSTTQRNGFRMPAMTSAEEEKMTRCANKAVELLKA